MQQVIHPSSSAHHLVLILLLKLKMQSNILAKSYGHQQKVNYIHVRFERSYNVY